MPRQRISGSGLAKVFVSSDSALVVFEFTRPPGTLPSCTMAGGRLGLYHDMRPTISYRLLLLGLRQFGGSYRHVSALVAVIFVGLVPRCYSLDARSLWFDESCSWRLTQFPFLEMLERVGRGNHPPLYFMLLQGWAALFGESPFALRSLSVLFGCLTCVGTYLFAVEAFGNSSALPRADENIQARSRQVGLFAAALVALSIFHIRYSWEARMYTLATTLAIFSSWALFRALRSPQLHRWLLYGILSLLLAYTHYYGLLTLAAQTIFITAFLLVRVRWNLAALFRDTALWQALLVAVLIILSWLPWLPVFLRQRAQVQESFWTRQVTRWDVARLCYQMFMEPESFESSSPSKSHLLLAADLTLLGLWVLRRGARAGEWYVLWSAIAPLLFCLLISQYDTKIFSVRYFLTAHLFLLIGLAVIVCRVPYIVERGLVVATVLVTLLGIFINYWQNMDLVHHPGLRGAAEYVQRQRKLGEPVVVSSSLRYFSLLYHAPYRGDLYLYTDGEPISHYSGGNIVIPTNLITEEQLQTISSQRVWVVDMAGGFWGSRSVPVPPSWVEKSQQRFAEVYSLGEVIVREYRMAPKQSVQSATVIKP